MKNEKALIVGGVVGLVAVIAAIAYEKKASASTTSTTSANSITLTPGPQSITAAQGVTLTLVPPAGGQIVTVTPSGSSATASGSTITVASSGYATVVYNDAAGAQQTSTINYTVMSPSGTTV